MVAGHDDDLDARDAGGLERLADPVAQRVGEADERTDLPAAVRSRRATATSRSPVGRVRLDQRVPARMPRRPRARPARGSPRAPRWRAPRRRRPDAVAAPASGHRDRPPVGDRARTRRGRPGRAPRRRRPPRSPASSDAVNEPGAVPFGADPGVVLGAQRLPQDGEPRRLLRAARSRSLDGDDVEPVPGERAGLVGDDQVDRAERLLGVQPPDEHAAAQQPVGTQAEDDRQQDRRLLRDRRDRRRDAGQEVRPGLLPGRTRAR